MFYLEPDCNAIDCGVESYSTVRDIVSYEDGSSSLSVLGVNVICVPRVPGDTVVQRVCVSKMGFLECCHGRSCSKNFAFKLRPFRDEPACVPLADLCHLGVCAVGLVISFARTETTGVGVDWSYKTRSFRFREARVIRGDGDGCCGSGGGRASGVVLRDTGVWVGWVFGV